MRCWRLFVAGACAFLCVAGPPAVQVSAQGQSGPEIVITGFALDTNQSQYHLRLSISNPAAVHSVDIRLLDLQSGENTPFADLVAADGRTTLDVVLSTAALQPGRKYRVAIRAVGADGAFLWPPGQSTNNNDPLTFASQEFAFVPPQPPQVTFTIDGVNSSFASRTLLIVLNRSDMNTPLNYEALIADKKGAAIQFLTRAQLVGSQLEAPMPEAMWGASQPVDYRLTVRLYTLDNKLAAEQTYEFTLPTPPQPGLFTRLVNGLRANPWLMGGIAGVLVILAAIVFLDRRPRKRRPLARPHNAAPVAGGFDQPSEVEAAGMAQLIVRNRSGLDQLLTLRDRDTTIGRSLSNAIVLNDTYVSRQHARVVRRGDAYVLVDEKHVSKPTHVNGRPIGGEHVLKDNDQLEVGRTLLVFKEHSA